MDIRRMTKLSSSNVPLRLLSILAVSLALLSGLVGCKQTDAEAKGATKGNQAPPVIPVGVATVEKRDVPIYLTGLGNVTALNTVNLKTRVDGQITKVLFKEGEDVKQGQLLIEIDPRPYQVALDQAKATLLRDQTQLTVARRNFERYTQLFKEGVVSREQLDQQESATGALEGTVRADQANIENQQLLINYTRITAPVSGRIGLRLVDIGNMVHASDQNPMLVITQLQPITAVFTLPEDSLRPVRQKMDRGTLAVDAYSRDDQTKLSSGKLLTIDNQIDPTTGTVRLKALFSNEDHQLWPNQFVNVRLLLDVQKQAVVIPTAAVQRGSQGTFAFVVKSDNTVENRQLTLGPTAGPIAVVNSGLAEGERIVTDGQEKLQAGSKVNPVQPRVPGNKNQNQGQDTQPSQAQGQGESGDHSGKRGEHRGARQ
jgi:multidrug efflux system membrane fusion protein